MKTLFTVAIVLLAHVVVAQNRVPQFRQYPAREVFSGKNASAVLTRKDRMYRTRLTEAATEKPNFAGRYIVAAWGCGAQCLMGAVIDAGTGRVTWFPHTVCCWGSDTDENFNPVEYRLDSRLIIFSGLRNEKDNDEGSHFYVFENGRFRFLRTVK